MMGDTRSLAGKVAMVTGSGRGMGRAHAVELARRGGAVVVHDVLAEEAEETMRQVRAAGAKAHLERADVTDPAAIREAVARAAQALGPIDILVNNAGIPAERTGIEEVTEEIYARLMAVHVKGTFFTTQAV
ncbi:MAG: SDR family NAD(P)-dependent oxidoreductase, partial [Alphaproteobacteria bacterium]|nr:SDR family NAD(P)-dependent oxidoreductase [Alphaproteobacteria bacterium]